MSLNLVRVNGVLWFYWSLRERIRVAIVCLDSRKLNAVTRKDAYSLPYISETLDNLRDAHYLSTIDFCTAFSFSKLRNRNQIGIKLLFIFVLAARSGLNVWRYYLDNGKKFTVYTDHSALKWFLSLSNPMGRLARWSTRLSEFNFEIKHLKGCDNVIPDALSRMVPVSSLFSISNYKGNDKWFLNIFNDCANKPNKLFRLTKSKNHLTSEFDWKEVIPLEHRTEIISINHDVPSAGHLGVFKILKRLNLKYF